MWLRLNEDKPLYHQKAASYFRFILDVESLQGFWFPLLPAMALVFNQPTVTAILDSRSKITDGELVRLCLRTCGQLQVRCADLLELQSYDGDTVDLDDIKSDTAKGAIMNGALERLLEINIAFVHRSARDFLLDTREGQSILNLEEITLEAQTMRYLRAAAATSFILRGPSFKRHVPGVEEFLGVLYVLLPSMSRAEETYKNWELLLLHLQDLFGHNVLLALTCTDFLGLAASYGFHVFVEASLKKLEKSSGITATYVNYILYEASSWVRNVDFDLGSDDQAFRSSVLENSIYRHGALVDWLLAYGADPNAPVGRSTAHIKEPTAFMRFLRTARDVLDSKPVYQCFLSTMKRFLDSGANLASLAYSFWYKGVEHQKPLVYDIVH